VPQNLTNEQLKHNVEVLLDKVAEELITNAGMYSEVPQSVVAENQKTIRNGIVQTITGGLGSDDILVLYQKEVKANPEDGTSLSSPLSGLASVVDSWGDIDPNTIMVGLFQNIDVLELYAYPSSSPDSAVNIMPYLFDASVNNPLNLSQFINLGNQQQNINPENANEYLNTNIYELLPTRLSRQQRIDNFFKEYQELKGNYPQWVIDPITGDLQLPGNYNLSHDISAAQDDPDNFEGSEENAFITRLNMNTNVNNTGKTMQSLRDDLNRFLEDIDQDLVFNVEDERPEYENKSEGFLKIRNLNQGIIIRKQEGDDIGIEQTITIPDTPSIDEAYLHPHSNLSGPSYLMNGFTITEWVRFLDKTSTGTLFNYGNPTRELDPKGFKLETFVLNKDDVLSTDDTITWGEVAEEKGLNTFENNTAARFIRLVVYDHINDVNNDIRKLYDSRMGIIGLPRDDNSVPELGFTGTSNWDKGDEKNLLAHTQIPIDFNEWFFVVASYNPLIYDKLVGQWNEDLDYWQGNRNLDESYTHYSGYGSKCKVEVISKTQLLTARGYKV